MARGKFAIASFAHDAEYVSALGATTSKSAGTTITLTVASVAIDAGDSIFVGFAGDEAVTTAWACTDNLGNTYVVENQVFNNTAPFGEYARAVLFSCLSSAAGTITSITVTWTTSSTAKGIGAAKFRGVGAGVTATQETTTGSGSTSVCLTAGAADGIVVAVNGRRDAGVVTMNTGILVARANTTGGSASSNVEVALAYAKPCTASGIGFANASGRGAASAGKSHDGSVGWP